MVKPQFKTKSISLTTGVTVFNLTPYFAATKYLDASDQQITGERLLRESVISIFFQFLQSSRIFIKTLNLQISQFLCFVPQRKLVLLRLALTIVR